MHTSAARPATTWPNPQLPSRVAEAGVSAAVSTDGPGHHLSVLDPLQVLRHPDDPVGIVAEPVRLDQAPGDGGGLGSGDLRGLEQVPAGLGKVIGAENRHGAQVVADSVSGIPRGCN